MKTNLTWILTLAFLMGLTHSSLSLAKAKEGGGGRGPLAEALKGLNLTEEQKTKIKEIRKSSKEASKEARDSLKDGHKALKDLMTGDGKKEEILSKFDSLQTLRSKMARSRFEMRRAVRDVLTPEQRKSFRAFLESHAGGRGKGPRGGQEKGESEED